MIDGHGDDIYRHAVAIKSNFSSNVYAGIDHEALFRRLAESLPRLCSYPEPEPFTLEAALAAFYGIDGGGVCFTNGATEAIYLVAQAFRGRRSAVWMPTFSEYADACRLHGHTVTGFYTSRSLPADADIVWLCNPNNPTGEVRDYALLCRLIQDNPDKLFVIDQSYEAFTLKRVFGVREAASLPNVLLIHSLTKHFAIPGLRAGYLTGNPETVGLIRRQRMPWSVNSLAIEAGMFALERRLALPLDLAAYLAQTSAFADAWRRTGMVDVWPTDTHFFLLRLRMGRAAALKEYLVEHHGILIRDASNFAGLDDAYFRLATQTPDENEALIRAASLWFENA